MKTFFEAVLPNSGFKFLATRRGDGYRHEAFEDLDEMVARALALVKQRKDVYFACASYAEASYVDENGKMHWRTGKNAKFVKAFFFDVDVGDDKPYRTQADAIIAIKFFCDTHKLPLPMLLSSGYGLHCYLPLLEEISKVAWKNTASKLKALMKCTSCPLMVDHSKTADVAAVLRPAGTLNFKREEEGVPVEVLWPRAAISYAEFERSVCAAFDAVNATLPNPAPPKATASTPGVPSLEEMAEALAHIDPDERERINWWGILAAMADAYGEDGRDLARRWSRRELMNGVSSRFKEDDFEYQYSDCFDRDDYEGERTGIGTIVKLARNGGWKGNFSTSSDWVEEINAKYAWIEKEASIYRIETGTFIGNEAFRTQFCNRFVNVSSGGGVKSVAMGIKWLQHPARREHRMLVMRPGATEVTEDNCLNTWRGFAEVPIEGCIDPFLRLLRRLVPDKNAARYVLGWMAHLLQHPGVKMHTALVIWSHTQGVGKNLLFECLKSIVGDRHATLIGQSELSRDFNEWAKDKILVIGDEVSGSDKREYEDKLKGLITGTTIQINQKYQPAYEVENLMNFVFLSNRPNAMFMDDNDRRYFVWEVTADKLTQQEAEQFVSWRDNGGLAALAHALLNVKSTLFNPKAAAPNTAAKLQMIDDNRSDFETWVQSIISSGPMNVLGRELVTARELAELYSGHAKISLKTVAVTLKKRGAYAFPAQVRLANKVKVRAMAIDRISYWKSQPEAVWAAELTRKSRLSLPP